MANMDYQRLERLEKLKKLAALTHLLAHHNKETDEEKTEKEKTEQEKTEKEKTEQEKTEKEKIDMETTELETTDMEKTAMGNTAMEKTTTEKTDRGKSGPVQRRPYPMPSHDSLFEKEYHTKGSMKKFLDRLAFMFAQSKDKQEAGNNVTATVFVDTVKEHPHVYVTKNYGCQDDDLALAKGLQEWIRAAATGKLTEDQRRVVWSQIIKFNRDFIDYYANSLKNQEESAMLQLFEKSSAVKETVRDFHTKCTRYPRKQLDMDCRMKILELSFVLRRFEPSDSGCTQSNDSLKIRKAIGFLGNYGAAFENFEAIASMEELFFKNLEIVCVELPPKTNQTMYSLKDFRNIIGLLKLPNPEEMWDTGREFLKGKCHAEVQLLAHLEKLAQKDECFKVHAYMGCSKKACWLCHQLLLLFQVKDILMNHKDSHFKVFPGWGMGIFEESQESELWSCVEKMENVIKEELKDSDHYSDIDQESPYCTPHPYFVITRSGQNDAMEP
jgi:hypothetical protein